MITNPSCPSESKETDHPQKFHSPHFDDELGGDIGGGVAPGPGLTDISGYHGQFVGSHPGGHYGGAGHYNGWYGQHQPGPGYASYYNGQAGGQPGGQPGQYYGGGGHYSAPGQLQYHQVCVNIFVTP